ncbi:MAG: UpxY family transcription antiterminator [Nitrospirota bacterium]
MEDGANNIDHERCWYALRVRSRHEFVTCEELCKKGIPAYLPSLKRWRQWKDRKRLVEFPLFPGYLFVRCAAHSGDYTGALKTRGAVSFVCSQRQPASISPEEMNSLKLMVESEQELNVFPHLTEGTRVRIVKGPLKGAEGVLEKKGPHFTFLVNIVLLSKSVGVTICADEVEAI